MYHFLLRTSCLIVILCAATPRLRAECPKPGGGTVDAAVISNPNRPTVSNPADLTQCGVFEVEYGWTRTWPGAGNQANLFEGLFRFGLLCDLELRWTTDNFLGIREGHTVRRGIGDNWTGVQYRFHRQSRRLPSMAFAYALKEPTASPEKQLGSGRFDHLAGYLASKDLRGFHADFNAGYLIAGRPEGPGRDHSTQLALAISHPLKGALGVTGELYGTTRLNHENPAFTSALWAISYSLNPRLTVDTAVDFGLTAGAPRKRLLMGVTYAIGQLYGTLK